MNDGAESEPVRHDPVVVPIHRAAGLADVCVNGVGRLSEQRRPAQFILEHSSIDSADITRSA